jgi:hypothetical protein
MILDVLLRRKFGIFGDSEGLSIRLGLFVLDLNFFFLLRAVLNGSHHVSQHYQSGVLGAWRIRGRCGTYGFKALSR